MGLWSNGFATDDNTDPKKLASLGLKGTDGALGNDEKPASVLLGPGGAFGASDKLLRLDTTAYTLWAFDSRGRAIDPGAVASWWAFLATSLFDNLWASGVTQRTCAVAAARSLHLVNAHEGALTAAMLGRASVGNASGAATDVVRQASGTTAVTIAFTAAPAIDNAPVPRAALLPHRAYATSVNLWLSGPVVTGLERDYARVALIDVESHLTGQPRSPAAVTPSSGETRRAGDQNRASTRINVARAPRADLAPLPLRGSLDDAADALISLLQEPAPVTFVTSQLDRDYGPLPLLAADSDPLPGSLPAPTVRALTGGGTASGSTIADHKVLIEFTLDPSLAGAMLRLWPNAVDLTNGRRRASDGGAGRVRADGKVSIVTKLPDGENAASLLGATAIMATGSGARLYGELRFTRPLAAGGSMLAWGSAMGAIIACEQDRFANTGAASGILPGTVLVHDDGTNASLIDPASVPASVFAANTVIRTVAAGDRMILTQPAFRAEPNGSSTAVLGASGATATQVARSGVTRPTGPGTPLPAQLALTSAAAGFDAANARAVLVPPPALARFHEVGAVQQGHPGSPATAETAGVGLDLHGPAALLVADSVSAVADAATPAFVAAAVARTSAPADPSGAALWAAALRTQTPAVEGERGLDGEVTNGTHPYPFAGSESDARTWYATNPSITIPAPAAGREAVAQRAMARRALAAGRGLQESAVALSAAFARAEDLVYIETPALDLLAIGSTDDRLQPLQALADRLAAQKALCAVVCVPVLAFLGAPPDLTRIRADTLKAALAALGSAAPGRFASFCPNAGAGRSLRLATTTVIVDDVFALTGTTHLSRRGLSFDSSLAVALLDEQNSRGRGQSLTRLRRALLAARLGLASTLVPDDGAQLVKAVTDLAARGSARLTTASLPAADPAVTDSDRNLWDRDGTVAPNPADLTAWLTQLASGNLLN